LLDSLFVLGWFTAVHSAARAQEPPAPAPSGVTAQRMETNLQNTPIAISAFGPDALKARAVTSFRDLAGQIPAATCSILRRLWAVLTTPAPAFASTTFRTRV